MIDDRNEQHQGEKVGGCAHLRARMKWRYRPNSSSHPVIELAGPSGLRAVSQHGSKELLGLAQVHYPGRRA
jgi:hypothetical protein